MYVALRYIDLRGDVDSKTSLVMLTSALDILGFDFLCVSACE